ncbi:MAG TPA: Ig-like domain-containing protein [Allosphingosinicella sp.]|nr:Ig-like domain-containing protein [Allosphingosinicella sp.]
MARSKTGARRPAEIEARLERMLNGGDEGAAARAMGLLPRQPATALDIGGAPGVTSPSAGFDDDPPNVAPTVSISALGGIAQGGEVRVNSFTLYDQKEPAIATFADGSYVVVWSSLRDGDGTGIYAQRFAASGARLGGEVRVNSSTAGSQYGATVAALTGGGYVVTWTGDGEDDGNIYAQRFDAAGATLGPEVQVNGDPNEKGDATVTALADGGYVVVWEVSLEDVPSGFEAQIQARRYDAAGVALGTVTLVSTTVHELEAPRVAALPGGGYVLAWTYFGADGDGAGIYAQRFDASGTALGGAALVNSVTASDQLDPSIAVLADGGYVIAWASSNQDGGGYGIYAQRFDAAGGAVGAAFRVNVITANDQVSPEVAALANGGFVVTWESALQDGSGFGIYARRYTAAGGGAPEVRVNTRTIVDQVEPAVAALPGGNFIIAWASNRQDASNYGIYAQRFGTAFEQVPFNLKGRIFVGDADAGSGILTMTFSTSYGILNATVGDSGATIVSGNGTNNLVVSGTLVQLLAFLNPETISTLAYLADTDDPPLSATLSVSVNDNGNSGAGGPLIASASQLIGITPVDDGPTVTIQPNGSVPEALEDQVNTGSLGNGVGNPAVAMLSGGNYVVVWSSFGQDGSDFGVYAQRFAGDGTPIGAEFQVNISTTGQQGAASVAALPEGGFLVTWQSNHTAPTPPAVNYEIYLRHYDANGDAMTGEIQVNTTTAASQLGPSIAVLENGNYVIGWNGTSDGGASGYFAQLYGVGGTPIGAEFRVNVTTAGTQLNSSNNAIAPLYGGGFIVTWQSTGSQDGSGSGVYARRYNSVGIATSSEFLVNSTTVGDQAQPSVVSLWNGTFVIVWQSANQDGSGNGIYAQRYGNNYLPVGGEILVNSHTAGNQQLASIAALSDGGFVITWESAGQDGNAQGVYAQRFDAAGGRVGDEIQVNSHTIDGQRDPAVAGLDDGRFVIVWNSFNQTGPAASDIYARRFGNGFDAAEEQGLDLKRAILIGGNQDGSTGNAFTSGESMTDVEPSDILTVTLSVDHGTLAVTAGGSGAGVVGSGTASVVLTGTLAQIQALLASDPTSTLVFTPAAGSPPGGVELQVSVDDGQTIVTASEGISIAAVNDEPAGADVARTINEDGFYVFAAADFGFSDPANGDLLSGVRIASLPAGGALYLDSDGAGTGSIGFAITLGQTISVTDLNAGRLVYVPPANASGSGYGNFTFQVVDDGGTANGGVNIDQSANLFTLNVIAVNDAPAITVPPSQTVVEDNALTLSGATQIAVSDVDATTITLTLSVAHGRLTLASTLGLAFSGGSDGTNDVTMIVSGSAAALNAALNAGLTYTPDADFAGADAISVEVTDNGEAGTGGIATDSDSIAIMVTNVNDAPVVDLNGPYAGIDHSLTFVEDGGPVGIGASLLVREPDEASGDLIEGAIVTLTDRAAGDSLAFSAPLPPGFSAIFTANATAITIEISGAGTAAQYQAILASIVYASTSEEPSFAGTDLNRTVTVVVDDGSLDSPVATATIAVQTVDDPAMARADAFTIAENGAITGGNLFAANGAGADSDPDGPALVIGAVNGAAGNVGTQIVLASGALLIVNANGSFDYNPNGRFLATPAPGSGASNSPGHDSFTYTLAGGTTATVSISLTGLDTDDVLRGTAGADTLAGGGGNDQYLVENVADIVIELAGGGNDRVLAGVSYALASAAWVETLSTDFNAGTAAINLTGNGLANTIFGNAGANLLVGGAGNDILDGKEGHDILSGGLDNDTLYGRDGNDTLYGGVGANYLAGGAGDDHYVIDNGTDHIEELAGQGNDRVYANVSFALALGASVETVSTSDNAGTASLNLTGNELANTIIGNNGANVLNGGAGNDVLDGKEGNDTLYGGANDDTLYGNGGNDQLYGGAGTNYLAGGLGDDLYFVDGAANIVAELAGQGSDRVYASVSYMLAAGISVEVLSTNNNAGTAALTLAGNELANTLFGNEGANLLDGGAGSDFLDGKGGADIFAFTTALGAGNVDTVAAFQAGLDRIALDDAIFTALGGGPGALGANAFHSGGAAADGADRIIYNSATGQLFYDADGTGAAAAIQFATLSPGLALAASDFTII